MKVAIIGGIASGKSTVLKILENLGAKVCSADDVNRVLLESPDYLHKLSKIFPQCFTNGTVNKKAIRDCIQQDVNKKIELEKLSHPLIMAQIEDFISDKKLAFVEISVPSSVDIMSIFDVIILVKSSLINRLQRLKKRDNVSFKSAVKAIRIQKDYKYIKPDFVVHNNKNSLKLNTQITTLFLKLNAKV